ncbi:uncharacterized protein METZ01_LOCUS15786 [marine metagenome]|uniref:Uncharacterized protein n=1 Tax=marine metagenome TaxID=408172 RepID=A0A381P7L3_9ZZZZ
MTANIPPAVYKHSHFLAQHIDYAKAHLLRLRQAKTDGGHRIKGVGIVTV